VGKRRFSCWWLPEWLVRILGLHPLSCLQREKQKETGAVIGEMQMKSVLHPLFEGTLGTPSLMGLLMTNNPGYHHNTKPSFFSFFFFC
jgi:hypothetical protein